MSDDSLDDVTEDSIGKNNATAEETTKPDVATADAGPSGARANRVVLVVALAVVAIACLVLSIVFVVHAADKRGAKPDNLALVDQSLTQEVTAQVSADVVKIFSYNYANAAASQQAAEAVLLDPGRQQYLTLVKLLEQHSQGQQLTLVVKVVQVGVKNLTHSTATVLVFLDQTSTRASDHATTTSAAQVEISAVKQGSAWKVNNIRTF